MQSTLIKDTTRAQRLEVVRRLCGDHPEEIYDAYIDGKKELWEVTDQFRHE